MIHLASIKARIMTSSAISSGRYPAFPVMRKANSASGSTKNSVSKKAVPPFFCQANSPAAAMAGCRTASHPKPHGQGVGFSAGDAA